MRIPTRCFEDVWTTIRASYFQWLKVEHAQFSYTVFLRFYAGRRARRPSFGGHASLHGKIAHNQVLPSKYNTKVHSWTSSGPLRPGTTDHTDISKPVYGIRTGPHGEHIYNRTGVPKPVDPYSAAHEPYETL